jgi:predicted nucleotidyltransferase
MDRQLFTSIVGSRLQGLDGPDSDTDTKGVFAATLDDFLDPFRAVPESRGGSEDTSWELSHFLRLCTKGNWTTLEALYSDMPVYSTYAGVYLRSNKHRVLHSKHMMNSALGYAHQLSQREYSVDKVKPLVHRWRVLCQAHTFLSEGEFMLSFESIPELRELKFNPTPGLIAEFVRDADALDRGIRKMREERKFYDVEPDYEFLARFCRGVYMKEEL